MTITNGYINSGNTGISNNENGVLILKNTNITANNTAINNTSQMNINGGEITGNSYAIYSNTTINSNVSNATLGSNDYALYKYYNKESNVTMIDTDVQNGNLYNGNGELNVTKGTITGTINNQATLSLDKTKFEGEFNNYTVVINNSSNATIDNIQADIVINDQQRNDSIIKSTGNLTINDSRISVIVTDTSSRLTHINAITNSGSLTSTYNNITITDTDNTHTYKEAYLTGIVNEGSGVFNSTDDTITLEKGGTSTGINNTSNSLTNVIKGITINGSDSKNIYGINSSNGTIAMETGTIDVSADNAYGIYIDSANATIDLGKLDGCGCEGATVSNSDPLVKAIGTTLGIGIKNNNANFHFYDGKLIGNTYAKPETTNLSETGWEARYYIVFYDNTEQEIPFGDEAGKTYEYEYRILKYLND